MSDQLLTASVSSASSLMALQLFSRLFTFALNQALFRMASPRAYGTAAIQFELMLSTILFLSREGVRNTLLRVWPAKESASERRAVSNLTFIPLIIGVPLSIAASLLYSRFAGAETRAQPHFDLAIGIYALAAVTELLCEPMHNAAMAELRTGVRVRAEGLGITSRTAATFLVLLYDAKTGRDGNFALVAFASGQFAYGAVVLVSYIAVYGGKHIWPQSHSSDTTKASPPTGAVRFNPEMLRLSLTMTSQSIIKHFLTEGDKLILTWFSPLQDQGGYAIAVNYGSLIARIVFQPIEETLRVFFSKVLAQSNVDQNSSQKLPKKEHTSLQQAAETLLRIWSVQASMSLILLVFGTAYMPVAIRVLLPEQYLSTSAPVVLAAWIWYIPVLALNGVLEAFLSSVASSKDLNRQSWWMASFSVIYILSAVGLYNLGIGDASLVYANIINLSARISYSLSYVSSYFAAEGAGSLLQWRLVIPSLSFLGASALSSILVRYSFQRLGVAAILEKGGQSILTSRPVIVHVTVGGILGLVCVGTWWVTSGHRLAAIRRVKVE